MLKWVIWLLVLANAGYWGWTQGHLAPLGLAPHEQREPQRLQAQIQPDALRLLNAPRVEPATPVPSATLAANSATGTAAPAPLAAPAPPQPTEVAPPAQTPASPVAEARACWLAGSFTEPQANTLRAALTRLDLPRDTWQLNEIRSSARWIVYMGRYENNAQLERKKAELRAMNVAYRTVSAPGLSPGLALGTYSGEAAAQQALQNAARSGVRTARVVQERAESISFNLRLPNATPAQRTAVAGLGAALAGKPLRSCN